VFDGDDANRRWLDDVRVPFDDRTLDALFEIGRGNLRATDDLALKSLDYAAAAGHATVSVQHIVAARKDLWP